ncbi:MAG TPA: extracellular solute-binding protein [Anaerolineales bacterium]|nr:extracellular solute-binding protein [Anaerolineales bacterium]
MMQHPSKKISRREFLRLAGLATAGSALAACGVNLPLSRPETKGTVQLVYQDWRTEWFPPMAQEMLGQFNADNPNIQVFYTPDPEPFEEKMASDFASGTAPDVLAGCCDFFPAWANAGYLLDLRPYVEADLDQETIADWSAAQYKALFTEDGMQFALPKYHGGLALYYNKDMFDAAGVDYPDGNWDHEDYLEALKRLTIREGDGTKVWGGMFDVSWDRIQVHVNEWGGHFVNPDDHTRCEMAAQPAREAMEWLRDRIWKDHVLATALDVESLETRQAFINQKIATVEDGSWALKDILEGADFRIGVAPFPSGPVRKATLATIDGFAINAETRHPDEAWELLKFLISKDYGRAMARANFLQPARASLVGDWVGYIRQQYPNTAKEVDIAAFADGHVKGYAVTGEAFKNMIGVGAIAEQAWDQIFTLGKAPVSDMIEVCRKIEAVQQTSTGLPDYCDCEEKV